MFKSESSGIASPLPNVTMPSAKPALRAYASRSGHTSLSLFGVRSKQPATVTVGSLTTKCADDADQLIAHKLLRMLISANSK